MKIVRIGSKQFQKLCDRNSGRNKRVTESVRKIVENVKLYGDDAVIKYTRKFDKVKLTHKELRVINPQVGERLDQFLSRSWPI